MNIPVNPIGTPPEKSKGKYQKIESNYSQEILKANTPEIANKKLTPKQKMQIKIRKAKDKQPKQPFVIAAAIVLLALFMFLGNTFAPFTAANTAVYENKGVQLTFLGDVMLGGFIKTEGDKNGYEQFYKDVKSIWTKSDHVFANLETAVLTNKKAKYYPFDKDSHISTDKKAVNSMLNSGINVIAFANNHSYDFSKKAFIGAVNWFEKQEIPYSGYIDKEAYNLTKSLNPDAPEKYKPYTQIISNDGTKIGFISVTDVYAAKAIKYGLLTTADDDLNLYINESKDANDLTVVYVHWGKEYVKKVTDQQRDLAHRFADAGADIIIGSHPQVLQPVEKYKNTMIFYSLGNFIVDQNNTFACDSVIVQYNKDTTGKQSFELIPIRINNGCPSLTTNSLYKYRIQKHLMSGFDSSNYEITESGNIVFDF